MLQYILTLVWLTYSQIDISNSTLGKKTNDIATLERHWASIILKTRLWKNYNLLVILNWMKSLEGNPSDLDSLSRDWYPSGNFLGVHGLDEFISG